MTDEDTARRLYRLKKRPTMASKSDDFLIEALEESADQFREYTHRQDPGEEVDGLIVELAVYKINQLGIEGATVASEGDMSRRYGEDIPNSLKSRMKAYRHIIGINGE